MRIAQVCPYSLSVPGGVQGQVMGLARALRELGHETRVLAPCDGPPPDPMVTPLGRSVPTAANGSIAPVAPDPACALRTIHALRNERFDVVHIHEPAVPGPSLTSLMTSDAALVGTFHAAGASTAYSYYTFAAKRFVKRLDVRAAVSLEAAATAQDAIGGQYELLFNAIDFECIEHHDPIQRRPLASNSGLDTKTIFFIGRHEQRKGLSVLLDALDALPENYTLRIGGVGPQTDGLQQRTRHNPRVTWLGRISDSQRSHELAHCDLFCAPSIDGESFGIVLLEAMAAGTPVVASNLSGYRLVTKNGQCALLVEPANSQDLVTAIERVTNDYELSARLVANALDRAKDFSMQTLAQKYLDLYASAIAKEHPRRWSWW